ncbi:DUF6326 family protein [Marispirochaeta sp.]|uniref:DUF6326 family protein n=1 Tax=Marispirochaeta sp. TaxID=2038653 RepID=UPI0029C88776|nr:DUF6326 family protein [Marispirochaeta sp.]
MSSLVKNRRMILSTLWIFVTLNYIYCDILGLMDAGLLKQYITAASIKTIAMIFTMFVGTPTIYYLFLGTVEILTTLFIFWYAWRWLRTEE